jgi:glycosyltransferase involved in cell wall biosynthesis
MRVPSLKKDKNALKKIIRKLTSIFRFVKKDKNGMYIFSPVSFPLSGHLGRKLNTFSVYCQIKLVMALLGFRTPVVYIGCPPALRVVRKLKRKYLVYERTDLFEEMPGADRSYIASLDNELTRSANLVLYVNTRLWEQGLNKNKNSLLIGHGVDFDLFANIEKNSNHVPKDIARIPKPIVGFFGDVSGKTSDFGLLEYIAEKLPGMSLVFVGAVSADVSRLNRFDNVYFLGQKPYDLIPHYGKEFDVAIMPWNRSRWIEFCNPIKIKEYLALGKPVVSTCYPEIEPYRDLVYVAYDYNEFISCIDKATRECDETRVESRRKRIENETWDSKVKQIKAAIEKGSN